MLYTIKFNGLKLNNVLIYGAGNCAVLISDIIHKDRSYNLIGFVDNILEKGNIINSLPWPKSSKSFENFQPTLSLKK